MTTLVLQPSDRTLRKVKVASWSAAWIAPLSTVAAGMVTEVWFPQMTNYTMEISALASLVLTGLGTWVAGYYTKERA